MLVPVVILFDTVTVVVPLDTVAAVTVVLAGIPVPVTIWPTPIKKFADAMVIVVPDKLPTAVKTPTFDNELPAKVPVKTGVSTVLSILVKFWPGCAISCNVAEPLES
jgi:hypothetical protein